MSYPTIDVTIKDKLATISFFTKASNSLSSENLLQLSDTINTLSQNNTITTVILKSEGNTAFCAGASFDELLQINDLKQGELFFSGFANVINAIRKSPHIYIARIHGKAVGGGVGLIAACDYSFTLETAAVKLSELAIGIGPFVIEPAVSRKIGATAFSAMCLQPTQWKSATWAQKNGLYNEVYSTIERLDLELLEYATKTSLYNPLALQQTKRMLWKNTENWDTLLLERAKISGELVLSDFTKQALTEFKKKK